MWHAENTMEALCVSVCWAMRSWRPMCVQGTQGVRDQDPGVRSITGREVPRTTVPFSGKEACRPHQALYIRGLLMMRSE